MDLDLHEKHQSVVFPSNIVDLFTEIISKDLITRKVFIYIGRTLNNQKKINNHIQGVTVNDIVENVKVERREKVKKGKSFTFQQVNTNIDRKAAERIVDKLLDMSLLYYTPVKPYKFLYMTNRGWQITEEMINRSKGAEITNG